MVQTIQEQINHLQFIGHIADRINDCGADEINLRQQQLRGLQVLSILSKTYRVEFISLDTNTGEHTYFIHKKGWNRTYTVRVKYAKVLPFNCFMIRSTYCNCPRFNKDANHEDCQHILMAIFHQFVFDGFKPEKTLPRFAEFRLAKIYQKEFENAIH